MHLKKTSVCSSAADILHLRCLLHLPVWERGCSCESGDTDRGLPWAVPAHGSHSGKRPSSSHSLERPLPASSFKALGIAARSPLRSRRSRTPLLVASFTFPRNSHPRMSFAGHDALTAHVRAVCTGGPVVQNHKGQASRFLHGSCMGARGGSCHAAYRSRSLAGGSVRLREAV